MTIKEYIDSAIQNKKDITIEYVKYGNEKSIRTISNVQYSEEFGIKIKYLDVKLSEDTAVLARDCDCVCTFVNDDVGKDTIDRLIFKGIKLIALRCAGYNNVDLKAASDKIRIARVPEYSPYAVAEHAVALILSIDRKIYKAYQRTRKYNFTF